VNFSLNTNSSFYSTVLTWTHGIVGESVHAYVFDW
jgi:hypothetical protein